MNPTLDIIAMVLLLAGGVAVFIAAGAPILFTLIFAGIISLFCVGVLWALYG